jgi:hypothetical protein
MVTWPDRSYNREQRWTQSDFCLDRASEKDLEHSSPIRTKQFSLPRQSFMAPETAALLDILLLHKKGSSYGQIKEAPCPLTLSIQSQMKNGGPASVVHPLNCKHQAS